MGMKFDLDSPATAEKGKVRFYVQKESLLIIKEGRRSIASKAFSVKKRMITTQTVLFTNFIHSQQ